MCAQAEQVGSGAAVAEEDEKCKVSETVDEAAITCMICDSIICADCYYDHSTTCTRNPEVSSPAVHADLVETDDEATEEQNLAMVNEMTEIIADELRHSSLGWRTVRWCLLKEPSLKPAILSVLAEAPRELTEWLVQDGEADSSELQSRLEALIR